MVSYLNVFSDPSGADVTIDGRKVGKTPIRNIRKLPGFYNIRIEKTGFVPWIHLNYQIRLKDLVVNISQKLKTAEEVEEERKKVEEEEEKEKEPEEKKLTWWEKLLNILKFTPFLKITKSERTFKQGYELLTGKEMTDAEFILKKAQLMDWVLPINALTKLFLGKNLKDEPEAFGSFMDYLDIMLSVVVVLPAAKVGRVTAKLITSKISKKGAAKLVAQLGKKEIVADLVKRVKLHPETSAKFLAAFPVAVREAVINGLGKTAFGREAIYILGKTGYFKYIAPGIKNLIARAGKGPKWFMSIVGMLAGYLTFANFLAWIGKEALVETLSFPIWALIDNEDWDGVLEHVGALKDSIELADKAMILTKPIPLVSKIWKTYIDNARAQAKIYEDLAKGKVAPEIPEVIETYVRDIIDGDTIDTSLKIEGSIKTLPEYKSTGHARIRILGINAPEKSPKGEIICSDIEIEEVDKKWTDESRDNLRKYNDKKVTLYVDKSKPVDSYSRILAKVVYDGLDLALEQIREGLACGYYREDNKYVDTKLYSDETNKAAEDEVGMWKNYQQQLEEQEKGKILFTITSIPDNAKVFIDERATHHNTPTDEIEQDDVISLWSEGEHTLKLEKSGMSRELEIELKRDERLVVNVDLTSMPAPEEDEDEEIPDEEIPPVEEITEPVLPSEIPETLTANQRWALNEAFDKILLLTEGTEVLSEDERKKLIDSYDLYSDEQKIVLNLLWRDLIFYTKGTEQLSGDEFILLKEKYHLIEF